jgi:hypothetical protein
MTVWAWVNNGVVVAVESADPAGRFPSSVTWVAAPAGCDVGWTYSGTTFAAPAAAGHSLAVQAQAALDKSDTTLLRCVENTVPVPAAWVAYRVALRAIVGGSSTATALPTMPAYPAGT